MRWFIHSLRRFFPSTPSPLSYSSPDDVQVVRNEGVLARCSSSYRVEEEEEEGQGVYSERGEANGKGDGSSIHNKYGTNEVIGGRKSEGRLVRRMLK